MFLCCIFALLTLGDISTAQPTNAEIQEISDRIWQADRNRITGNDVQYNINGAKFFTYVNEARFTGTYRLLINLFPHYNPDLGVPENCGATCQNAQNAFLDGILSTEPMTILHGWLFQRGLAGSTTAAFRNELRQYFFMAYGRSSGAPLESSGFEHVFLGEIRRSPREVTGLHNWVKMYFAEKDGDLRYGPYARTCPNEVYAFGLNYLNAPKSVSSMFIRTSPEVEVALYTLCLLTRNGSCPVRRNGVNLTMTVWDMTGLPKTVGSAYPNC